MKIGDSIRPARISRAGEKGKSRNVSAAGGSAPTDKIVLMGIPEVELTPRVRKALISLVNDMQDLRAELAETKTRLGELEQLADRDPLLNVLNRRAFARELDKALAMIARHGMRASLVFIDLNDLKIINDTMGHGAGDASLLHVAALIEANIRQTDAVARLGGDEFGVLLFQTGQARAEMKAEEIASLISASPILFKDQAMTARISWGAVEIQEGYSAEQAMEYADSAMYEAKKRK